MDLSIGCAAGQVTGGGASITVGDEIDTEDVQLIVSQPDAQTGTPQGWEAQAWFGDVDGSPDTATLTVYALCGR